MHRSIVTSLALASALAAPLSAQQFVYNSAALPAQAVWTDGVACADVDGDGDVDILFANGSAYGGTGGAGAQPQHLFLNNGSGSFSAAHANLNVANFNAKMVIADDFDNDGDLDLAYASGSTGSPPRLLLNNGAGVFTDMTGSNMPALALRSFCIVAGDVDDDGDLDLAVSDGGTFGGTPSQARLLRNNGSAVFTDVTAAQMPVDLYNCQDITFVDFDGDFDVDMLLTGKGAAGKRGRLYVNNGSGTFSIDNAMDAVCTGNTYEADWGDLDGDGDFDSNVQSISGTSEGWARNNGTGVAMTKTTYPAPNGNDDNEMAQLDYDNDGDLDCFVGSLASTEKAYRNDGGTFVNVNSIIQAQGDATLDFGFGDFNGNGKYDMVTAQGESGNFTNKVYRNTGPSDTLGPVFMAVEPGAAITGSEMVVHAQISDQMADDGKISASLSFSYTTNLGSGSGDAIDMGNGLCRVAVPTPGGTTSVSLDLLATDAVGNTTAYPTINVGGSSPWTDLGGAKAGTGGLTPVLTGTGPLTALSNNSVDLSNGLASTTTNLLLGLSTLVLPFKGGTLVPSPDALFLGLPVDGSGNMSLPFVWPNGIPAGAKIYLQHWLTDGGVSFNLSASNGLQGEAQ